MLAGAWLRAKEMEISDTFRLYGLGRSLFTTFTSWRWWLLVNVCGIQLQVLIDDSTRLQEAYPGGNAEHIASQQAMVVDNWDILQQKSAQRKSDLQATMDLYWFLNAVRSSNSRNSTCCCITRSSRLWSFFSMLYAVHSVLRVHHCLSNAMHMHWTEYKIM